MLWHPQVLDSRFKQRSPCYYLFHKTRLTFGIKKITVDCSDRDFSSLKHILALPPVVSRLHLSPSSKRSTAGPLCQKYPELAKTKGSTTQKYFRNTFLHWEKCPWIIICVLEAVCFLCLVFYYFWKNITMNTKCTQLAGGFWILKIISYRKEKICSRKEKKCLRK